MMERPEISIVSPVYYAEKIVAELTRRLIDSLEPITPNFEIILVNDGSQDGSWEAIQAAGQKDSRVKGYNLSRNFGQHQAIFCGLQMSQGNYTIVIDCDLQDNPAYIPQLYETVKQGYDLVYTAKKNREHAWHKNVTAKIFNAIFNFLVDNKSEETNDRVGSLSILSRKVVDAFCSVDDYERHYLMTLRWVGFKSTTILIDHDKRFEGKSTYTWKKLINHAINGITFQSDKLLRLNITIGFIIASLALLAGLVIIALYFIQGFMSGWTSLIVTLFFIYGTILISFGIVGLYIGKIFDQVKNRPKYIVSETVNVAEKDEPKD